MAKFKTVVIFGFAVVNLLGLASGLISELELGECMNVSQEVGRISSLTLTPYPPHIHNNVSVSATVTLFRPVTGNIRMELEIRRKLGFLGYALKIPCISNIGTCSYPNVCTMLSGEDMSTTVVTSAAATNSPVSVTDNPVSPSSNSVPVTDNTVSVSNNHVSVTDNPVSPSSNSVPVTDNPVSVTEIPVSVSSNPVSDSSGSAVDAESTVSNTPNGATQTSALPSIPPVKVTDLYSYIPSSPVSKAMSSFSVTGKDVSSLPTRPDIISTDMSVLVGRDVEVREDQPATRPDVSEAMSAGTELIPEVTDIVQSSSASVSPPALGSSLPVSTAATSVPSVDTSMTPSTVVVTSFSGVDASVHASTSISGSLPTVQSTQVVQDTSTEKPTDAQPVITTETIAATESFQSTDLEMTQTVTDVSGEPATTSSVQGVSEAVDEGACPAILVNNNIPCQCPFEAGVYTVNPTAFEVPTFEGIPNSLVMGDYKIKVSFFDGDTGEMLMCQIMEASIAEPAVEQPCTSSDCVVG